MRSRLGIRAIGLCLALAGLMAVGASSAQAEAGAFWLVKGVKVTTLLPELAASLEGNHGVILAEMGGVGIHFLCTGVAFVAGNHLLAEGGLLGKVQFSGCKILKLKVLNGATEVLGGCTVPGGTIETTTGKGLIRLSGGSPNLVIEPNEGTTFATISVGEECAFGEKISMSGKIGVKDCKEAFLTDQVEHLVEENAASTELYLNGNKANKATIDGSVNVKLAGVAHTGLTWAGHAG